MKYTHLALLLPLVYTACSDSGHDHSEHDLGQAETSEVSLADPVTLADGVTIVEMTGNDRMQYNIEAFTVPAGSPVKLIFGNVGKMPKAAMGHNVVFLKAEVDSGAFATAAAAARDNDYIPAELEEQILVHTKMLGPGESETLEFNAPKEPGEYEYLCTFPAHMYAGMRGVMTVE